MSYGVENIDKRAGGSISVSGVPNECPYCNTMISSTSMHYHIPDHRKNDCYVFVRCTNFHCEKPFIALYNLTDMSGKKIWLYSDKIFFPTYNKNKHFSDIILEISPSFIDIYHQSEVAEHFGLSQICGIGYRKAIEFLVKDYAAFKYPDQRTEIEKKPLKPCIDQYITSPNAKIVVERAVWIGNDETHYTKKWIEKDINDLKLLIELTIKWVELERLTEQAHLDMPTGR